MFGSKFPCYHCFCLHGRLPHDTAEEDSGADDASDLDESEEGGHKNMGREEAEAAALCADDPQGFTLALDMGEAR